MSHLKLVRKKSGEAVKSPLRPSTSSSTSTKAVHFSENLEQIRHFLRSKCTASISADSSPTDEAQQYTSTLPDPSKISPCQYTRWEALHTIFIGVHETEISFNSMISTYPRIVKA
ncbi:hypothetical protein EJ05DRAFT_497808 [Pseudovirgaria hyperparasitica]|uniref:Uncharacterized protein n=1 Tax=Pseudovirgaria hyperparasitica TaxID=470096 RepID=A0A6A6WHY1_9PEZI|nr:uncharacterized protein EJ05DRAFT_497808 [Pseudovirgaria hyperparasitica]KAF2761257.1 hypothetical protein EJ05DRAFT_497808 [Pseudovirgaria hyperparasitica]